MAHYRYNRDLRKLVDSTGRAVDLRPELSYGESAVWEFEIVEGENIAADLSGLVSFRAAVDADFSGSTEVMARVLPEAVTVDGSTVRVELDATSSNFLSKVDGREKTSAWFELAGLTAAGARGFYLIWPVTARMTLDPDLEAEALPTPALAADRAWVTALLRAGEEVQLSSDGVAWTAYESGDPPDGLAFFRLRNRTAGGEWSDAIPLLPGPVGATGPAGPQGPQGETGPADWSDLTGIPAAFPPADHTHAAGEIAGLADLLDGKLDKPPVGACRDIRCITQGTTVRLKWRDPDDLALDGVTLATWRKTTLVRKAGGDPDGPSDGTVIVTGTVRDQYASAAFVDTIPDAGTVYHYQFFPWTTDNAVNSAGGSAVTGELTWATILDLARDPDFDLRELLSAGDVLTAANSLIPTDGNGNFEWQVTDVTRDDFGLVAYKIPFTAQFDAPQKAYALTADPVFHREYSLVFSNWNIEFYIADKAKTGKERVWKSAAGDRILYYGAANARWQIDYLGTPNVYQTADADNPYDSPAWSQSVGSCTGSKKYYTLSGGAYIEATVADGEVVPADTCYEANPGGANQIAFGSNDYENSPLDQMLNSSAAAGAWYTAPTIWSNTPAFAGSMAGFMSGFDAEFLAGVKDTSFVVNNNNICAGGGSKTLTRKFYLLSQSEVGFGGTEGSILEFYNGAEDADRIKFQLNNATFHWWLRSPYVGNSNFVYYVYSSGALGSGSASGALGIVPACRIG